MPVLKSALTLTGTAADYGAALALSTSTTFSHTHTSGISKEALKSTSKTCTIAITDGDAAVADAGTLEGQYVDITDNHGLKRRYVFLDGANTSVATGDVLVAGSDIGAGTLTALSRLDLVDGIGVDVTDGLTQNAILALLATAINHANGHNGSIVATAPAGAADGIQTTTLTNRDSSAPPFVDKDNSTLSILNAATNSMQDHVKVIEKGRYTSPAIYYIRNTAAYNAANNRIFLYWNDTAATEFMEIRGGQFAYIPANPQYDLLAYTTTADTVVEFAAFGTNV